MPQKAALTTNKNELKRTKSLLQIVMLKQLFPVTSNLPQISLHNTNMQILES